MEFHCREVVVRVGCQEVVVRVGCQEVVVRVGCRQLAVVGERTNPQVWVDPVLPVSSELTVS